MTGYEKGTQDFLDYCDDNNDCYYGEDDYFAAGAIRAVGSLGLMFALFGG